MSLSQWRSTFWGDQVVASVLVVEQDECRGSDRADPPRAQADPTSRLERGLEQGVSAFGQGAGRGMQRVDAALVDGRLLPGRGLIGQVSRWFSPS
jgi:hypothetical protein